MDNRYSAVKVALCHSPRTEGRFGYYVIIERADSCVPSLAGIRAD
jgi:hypothetical protein